jgi:hypothetical protein
MHKRTIRCSLVCLGLLLLMAPALLAQDLFNYRSFSVGMSLDSVLKCTGQSSSDVKLIHSRPALIQELAWWPLNGGSATSQSDPVEQILFSFYDNQLYKVSVTYDRTAVEGLTADDMVQSLSAKYGSPSPLKPEPKSSITHGFDAKQKVIATWEDSLSIFNLVRSSYSDEFGLVLFSKRLTEQADAAIVESTKLDEQERPQKEAEQRKKEAAELETARQKNRKVFQP